jgi:hypothetical protein
VAPQSRIRFANGEFSEVAFHHMSFEEHSMVLNRLMLPHWAVHCMDNHLSCGSFCAVVDGGLGNVTFSYICIGPFQG